MTEEEQIQIVSDIIYEYLKSKHKDALSQEIAKKIIEALRSK